MMTDKASDEDWAMSMREICEFSTVEEFWKFWSFIPRPRYGFLFFSLKILCVQLFFTF